MRQWLLRHGALLLTLAVFVGTWLFWWIGHPEILCYHEQNQMFLWTWGYLAADLSISGGLADYVSECIVQFYFVPWLGALLLGLLFAAMQWLSWGLVRSYAHKDLSLWWLPLSLVPGVVLLLAMGDIEVLLAFPLAVTLAIGAAWLANSCRGLAWWMSDVVGVVVLFWAIGGGATWLYVALRLGYLLSRPVRAWASLVLVPWLAVVSAVSYRTFMAQYPLDDVLVGVGYYRVPQHHPFCQMGYTSELCNALEYNMLLRHEDWDGIIALARKHQEKAEFTCQCVNLALGMKRQLADKMFTFYQSGEDALIGPRIRNNMSMYPSMEAFWRIGLVNETLRYAFDLQEGILSNKMSARLTKRIAECNMVDGNYAVARMNLGLLKKTLFYRAWAEKHEAMLGNDTAISHDAYLNRARRFRYQKDLVFSYEEKQKIFGLLFVQNIDNKLALDYFMADMLLKGQLDEFYKYMAWVQQYGGYLAMPIGYQDALNVRQHQRDIPDSPYGNYARRMLKMHNDAHTGATKPAGR